MGQLQLDAETVGVVADLADRGLVADDGGRKEIIAHVSLIELR